MASVPEFRQIKSLDDFIDAIRIRAEVFIIEQGRKPGWEPDEDDKTADQFAAVADGKIVGTARVRNSGSGEFKIERMAVKKEYRCKGIGQGLVKYIVEHYKALNSRRIWMQSQIQVQRFYEKCGFRAVSKPYDLYGTEHIDMEL